MNVANPTKIGKAFFSVQEGSNNNSILDFIHTHLCTLQCVFVIKGWGGNNPRGVNHPSFVLRLRGLLINVVSQRCHASIPIIRQVKRQGGGRRKWIFSVQERDQVPIPMRGVRVLNSLMGRGNCARVC
jgi:hypothetical protein